MPKNILIFSDGTGQAGGLKPDQHLSNVYKLFRATRVGPDSPVDPAAQIAFYDAGLGTEKEHQRRWRRFHGRHRLAIQIHQKRRRTFGWQHYNDVGGADVNVLRAALCYDF